MGSSSSGRRAAVVSGGTLIFRRYYYWRNGAVAIGPIWFLDSGGCKRRCFMAHLDLEWLLVFDEVYKTANVS
ncbi:MAG: hypothetical protein JF629_26625, partial [Variovorax paradoxus]